MCAGAKNNSNIEYEIKLDLSNEGNYNKLVASLGAPLKDISQSNYFFDTSDSQLMNAKWALRLRISEVRDFSEPDSSNDRVNTATTAELTLKGPQQGDPELSVRSELNAEISAQIATAAIAGGFDLTSLDEAPIIEMQKLIGAAKLIPLVSFTNQRLVFVPGLEIGCVLEVDSTTFGDDSKEYELELEFSQRDVENEARATTYVRTVLHKLEIPYQLQTKSKFATALTKGLPLK